jgi:hypothetical protein
VHTWERAWRFESYLPTKQADLRTGELKEKALPALRQFLNASKASTGARVVAGCQVALVPSNQAPAVDGTADRVAMRATARLHGTWASDIWPHGVAVVGDAFVVDLLRAHALDDLEVLAARWEPAGAGGWATVTAAARARRRAGEWHLSWDGG